MDTIPEIIQVYQDLIQSQQETYNLLVIVFLAILGLFGALTWWWNKSGAQKFIRQEIDKTLSEQIKTLTDQFNKTIKEKIDERTKDFELEFNWLRAESARLFAIGCKEKTGYFTANAVWWWSVAMSYYLISGKQGKIFVGITTENLLKRLQDALKVKPEFLKYFTKAYSFKTLMQKAEAIPEEIFTKKNKIIEIINKLQKS